MLAKWANFSVGSSTQKCACAASSVRKSVDQAPQCSIEKQCGGGCAAEQADPGLDWSNGTSAAQVVTFRCSLQFARLPTDERSVSRQIRANELCQRHSMMRHMGGSGLSLRKKRIYACAQHLLTRGHPPLVAHSLQKHPGTPVHSRSSGHVLLNEP